MEEEKKAFPFKTVYLVLFFATIGIIATDIYLPSFPAIKKELATSNTFVQLSFSLYLLTFSLSQLFYGPYSEKYGRKKVFLFGLTFSLLGNLVCIFAPNISVLILGRALQGLGLGVGPSLFRAILRDLFTGYLLAYTSSLAAIVTAFMMAVIPILGGYIQTYLGWRYSFLFLFLYTTMGILLVKIFLQETLTMPNLMATKPKVMMRSFFLLIKSPIFVGYASCGSFAFAGITAYLTVSPFLLQTILGWTPKAYGWLALLVAMSLALGGLCNSFFVKRVGRHTMLFYGTLLMLLGSIVMTFFALRILNSFVLLFPIFLFISGTGIAFGNASAGALHHFPKIAGFVGSLYGSIQMLGSSIAGSVMALLHERNQIPLSVALLIMSFGALFSQWLGCHYSKKLEQKEEVDQ